MTKEEYKQAQRELQREEMRESNKFLFVEFPLFCIVCAVVFELLF